MNRKVRSGAVAVILLTGAVVSSCTAVQESAGGAQQTDSSVPEASGAIESEEVASLGLLAGTDWRLVEIQSMDDAVGIVRPDDPSMYTMRLNEDGTVIMRLDCNRARGTWSAEPSADVSSGNFSFGPLAATRAVCPPGSLDERVAAQTEYVRSYLLEDGRLYLSLMADGGIFAWEPDEGRFQTEPDAVLEEAIRRASPGYTRELADMEGGLGVGRYVYSRIDLNEDGEDEVLVYLLGPFFCGSGGCDLLLFTDADNGYSLVNDFPISREPVIVSPERTGGWQDLIRPESGGGAKASYVKHIFDGEKYVEHERIPADTVPVGTRVLTGGFSFEDGAPLEPRS